MNPPIITTTAATPQDSPITTLAHGKSFAEWEKDCLRPPSVMGSVKGLNNLLPPEPYPNKRKIDSPSSNRSANTFIDLESKASLRHIKSDQDGTNQNDGKSKTKRSLKKRPSEKRKEKTSSSRHAAVMATATSATTAPAAPAANYETEMLNNERLDSVGSLDVMHKSTKHRGSISTKNTNKISPRDHRQYETNEFYENASNYYKNSNEEQHNHREHRGSSAYRRRRRLSTIDPNAFKKLANLDIQQLEMLRARALQREKELKESTPPTVIESKQEQILPCKGFIREPMRYVSAKMKKRFEVLTENRESHSLYIFAEENKFRLACDWFVSQKWFDNVILLFIALNCITLAMERPNIPPNCIERYFLSTANYVFTFVFTLEMFVKVRLMSVCVCVCSCTRILNGKSKMSHSFQPFSHFKIGCCNWYV